MVGAAAEASAAIENLTGINMANVFTNALDNANLTGSAEERAIRAREPDTVAEVDVNVTTDADAGANASEATAGEATPSPQDEPQA